MSKPTSYNLLGAAFASNEFSEDADFSLAWITSNEAKLLLKMNNYAREFTHKLKALSDGMYMDRVTVESCPVSFAFCGDTEGLEEESSIGVAGKFTLISDELDEKWQREEEAPVKDDQTVIVVDRGFKFAGSGKHSGTHFASAFLSIAAVKLMAASASIEEVKKAL